MGSKYIQYRMVFPKAIADADRFDDETMVEVVRYGDDYVLKRVRR